MNDEEINNIKSIMIKFNHKLESYEIDKKFGQLSVDSISHLFPSEIEIIKKYIEQLEQENKELKERIDKAIEYINKVDEEMADFEAISIKYDLLSTLKGGKIAYE